MDGILCVVYFVGTIVEGHFLAHQENIRVPGHFLVHGRIQGVPHGDRL